MCFRRHCCCATSLASRTRPVRLLFTAALCVMCIGANDADSSPRSAPRIQADVVYESSTTLAAEIRATVFARSTNPFTDADGKPLNETDLDVEAMFEQEMKRYRFSSKSVIDTHTAYLVALWSVYQRQPLPREKLAYAVNHQVGEEHRRETNEIGEDKKQRLAHHFMWNALIVLAQREKRGANHDRLSQAALHMARENGFDFSTLVLTERGFERK
jgi:hypothetical protein